MIRWMYYTDMLRITAIEMAISGPPK